MPSTLHALGDTHSRINLSVHCKKRGGHSINSIWSLIVTNETNTLDEQSERTTYGKDWKKEWPFANTFRKISIPNGIVFQIRFIHQPFPAILARCHHFSGHGGKQQTKTEEMHRPRQCWIWQHHAWRFPVGDWRGRRLARTSGKTLGRLRGCGVQCWPQQQTTLWLLCVHTTFRRKKKHD